MTPAKPMAFVVLAVATMLLPLAQAAAYEPGSALEADAPVLLSGRTDALVPHGVVSYISPGKANLEWVLEAEEAAFAYHVSRSCATAAELCAPLARDDPPETWTLTDARVMVTKVLGRFMAAATNDPEATDSSSFGAPGPILATANANALLGATGRPVHLSPFSKDWTSSNPEARQQPVYTVEAGQLSAGGLGGTLRASGGFETLLQGVEVHVTGTDERGRAVDRVLNIPAWNDDEEPVQYLVVEALGGNLAAHSAAPMLAYGVSTVDVLGSATMSKATGKVVSDAGERAYESDDVTLAGPLALTLTTVTPGSPIRLGFALSSTLRAADAIPPPAEERDPVELVAAGVAGAAGAGILAAFAYFWPRLKFASTLLFLPLYTRIERTAVLDHEKRDEIYGLIRDSPGIHAHEIGEKANIGWGTTVYHLKLLEQHSLVVSQRSGRYKRFFVNTGEYTKKKDVYGALRNETAKAVADFIVNNPGCNQKQLCEALSIQPSLASWHVEKLEGVELVKRVKDGRMVRYFAGPAWELLNVRIDPAGGASGVAET